MKIFASSFVAFLFLIGNAKANLLTNGSFDAGSFVDNGVGGVGLAIGSTAITGWTTTTAELAWLMNGNAYGLSTPFGPGFLDLTGYHDQTPYGGVSQMVNLAAGAYVLTFSLGSVGGSDVFGGTVSAQASAGNQTNLHFSFTPSEVGNQWALETLAFTVANSGNTIVSIVGTESAANRYLGIDNVDLEAVTVPTTEPGTAMSVLAAACAFSGLWLRRRLRKTA